MRWGGHSRGVFVAAVLATAAGLPATASGAPAPAEAPAAGDDSTVYPRLVLAVHGQLGPHSPGEEVCMQSGRAVRCDRTGRFLGAGGDLSLRVRLYRFLYADVRFMALGNAFGPKPESLHDGLLAPAAGLALMTDHALVRLEFIAPFTLGNSQYRAPGSDAIATETWGHAAGSFALGARLPFHSRVHGELTAGVQVGPAVDRVSPANGDRRGPLVSFQIGIGTAFTLVR